MNRGIGTGDAGEFLFASKGTVEVLEPVRLEDGDGVALLGRLIAAGLRKGLEGWGYVPLVPRRVIEHAHGHAMEDRTRESGGVVRGIPFEVRNAGERGWSGMGVLATEFVPAEAVENTAFSVRFTHETWRRLLSEGNAEGSDDPPLAGWFHTHPGFPPFLSEQDLFIQRNFFDLRWQFAWVYDPVSGHEVFHRWNGLELLPSSAFLIEDADSVRLLRILRASGRPDDASSRAG